MFTYNAENKTHWFSQSGLEANIQYELFGALIGLAIYNNVILDIRFPLVVYRKLLSPHEKGFVDPLELFDDLLDVNPEVGRSLMQLLDFEGNVEEVLCRDYVASYESFGTEVVVPLIEGGENIPITNDNREDFVVGGQVNAGRGYFFLPCLFPRRREILPLEELSFPPRRRRVPPP